MLIYHCLISFRKENPAEIKEFVETTITIEKETAGLGLGIVGGSDTYLVRRHYNIYIDSFLNIFELIHELL